MSPNVTESPCITHLLQAVIFCQISRVPITANRNLHSGCFTHHTVRHTGVLLKESEIRTKKDKKIKQRELFNILQKVVCDISG